MGTIASVSLFERAITYTAMNTARFRNLRLEPTRLENIVILFLLIAFLLVTILSSPQISVTLDEPLHYHYGLFVLQGNTNRIDDSSMPVLALNAFPAYIASRLPTGPLKETLEHYFMARLVTILYSAAVAYLIFHWSRSMYGFAPAIFSTVLYILDPNIIAHSQLVTTDIFITGMTILTFYLIWKFANKRNLLNGLLCAIALGLSQLVKYTAVALFPLAVTALIIHDWPTIKNIYKERSVKKYGRYVGQLASYLLVALIITTVIINLGFRFNHTFTSIEDYRFRSSFFQSLQANLTTAKNISIPLPYPYLQGLDWMIHTNQTADRYGNIYLLGHVSKPQGFPGYYFVAFALKVPIATQILALAALGMYFLNPRRRVRFTQDEVFCLTPIAFFTIYFNFFFNAQTGIRYELVIFPLLFIFTGSLFVDWETLPRSLKAAGALAITYLAISTLSYFPHFTPYFNELVWDKRQTYKYLADSNLEWGQSTGELEQYLSQHPDAIYSPNSIEPGLLVVSGSDLVGILTRPEKYAWLRDNFKPVDTIAYAYFVYKITPEEIAKLCMTTTYCR